MSKKNAVKKNAAKKNEKKAAKKVVKKVSGKKVVEGAEEGSNVSVKSISIPRLRVGSLIVDLVGLTPYIQNRFSEKQLDSIADSRMKGGSQKAAKKQHAPLNPEAEMIEKIHFMDRVENGKGVDFKKSKIGIPVSSLTKSMAMVTFMMTGVFKKETYAAMTICPDDGGGLIKLKSDTPTMRRGYGNCKGFIIYYQPVFSNWSCRLKIRYDKSMITENDILAMLEHAGLKVGIGNNRPEKGGECGTFRIGDFFVGEVEAKA